MKTLRTLVLVGGGAKPIYEEVRTYVTRYKLPTVHTLNGKGVIDDRYQFECGMIGWKGGYYANQVLQGCERLIIVGSRLDIRQMDANLLNGKSCHFVNVTTDRQPIGKRYKQINDINVADATPTLWFNEYGLSKNEDEVFDPLKFCALSYEHKNWSITTDVGDNQMYVANYWDINFPYKWITSGGLGTMGFAIPAAIGVACQGRPTIAICGDGGFQMNVQELETIKYFNLPIKIIVINNGKLNLVKTFQDECGLCNQSTVTGYSCPDIKSIVQAYGFSHATNYDEFTKAERHMVLEII